VSTVALSRIKWTMQLLCNYFVTKISRSFLEIKFFVCKCSSVVVKRKRVKISCQISMLKSQKYMNFIFFWVVVIVWMTRFEASDRFCENLLLSSIGTPVWNSQKFCKLKVTEVRTWSMEPLFEKYTLFFNNPGFC